MCQAVSVHPLVEEPVAALGLTVEEIARRVCSLEVEQATAAKGREFVVNLEQDVPPVQCTQCGWKFKISHALHSLHSAFPKSASRCGRCFAGFGGASFASEGSVGGEG
eukprot:1454721-Amphidinium_carterae.1